MFVLLFPYLFVEGYLFCILQDPVNNYLSVWRLEVDQIKVAQKRVSIKMLEKVKNKMLYSNSNIKHI